MPRMLSTLAFLLARASAPALDFVAADLRQAHGEVYRDAVASFRSRAVCTPPRGRYTAQHRGSPRTVGERLVLPVQERRVPIAASYEWHFLFATRLSWPGDLALGQALSPELECATRYTFECARNGTLTATRQRAAAAWSATCEGLRSYSAAIIARHAPQHAHMIMADTNVACMAANMDALDYRNL